MRKRELPAAFKAKQFRPGQSGNLSGRPAGSEGLAKRIREVTRNGEQLVELLIKVAEGKIRELKRDRLRAIEMLLDRGFGRPLNAHAVAGEVKLGADEPLRIEIVRESDWKDAQ